jgi:hypothetical protein
MHVVKIPSAICIFTGSKSTRNPIKGNEAESRNANLRIISISGLHAGLTGFRCPVENTEFSQLQTVLPGFGTHATSKQSALVALSQELKRL